MKITLSQHEIFAIVAEKYNVNPSSLKAGPAAVLNQPFGFEVHFETTLRDLKGTGLNPPTLIEK